MGQVRRRGNVWWVRYYRQGRRYEESAHTPVRAEAEHLLRLREGDIARGLPVTARVGQLRFEEAAADLITDYRVNGRRALPDVTRRVKRGLTPCFAGRRMANLTTTDVRGYIDSRQTAGAANATINRELAALKRMYSLAIQAGKLLYRPHIPMLREDNVRRGFFEREQFESVRKCLDAPLSDVVTFAYYTGWRTQSEILSLQWHQVDLDNGIVRLDPGQTKSREGRTFVYREIIELCDVFTARKKALDAQKKRGRVTPWVFHRSGKQIKSFRGAWQTACEGAGCPGRILHDFRRTAVRNLVRAGVPDSIAMKLTGHKTRSVFDRYDITSEADLAEAGQRLNALAGARGIESAKARGLKWKAR